MLTDVAVRNAKPGEKLRRIADSHGLCLEVSPSGGKLWRYRYRFNGKEQLLALGRWPDVSLKDARRRRDEARELLDKGINPSDVRRQEKLRRGAEAEATFAVVAREWVEQYLSRKSDAHRDRTARRLEKWAFPSIGRRPIASITAPEILAVARRAESFGKAETAHRLVQAIGQVIRYAIATGRAHTDPTLALRGALQPVQATHMPSPAEDPDRVGAILRAMEAFDGGPVVGTAMRLLPMLFVRPGELRTMRWADVDLDAAVWRYTTSKTRTEHFVPLPRQAVQLLRNLQPLTYSLPGGWVFPGGRSPLRPMSDAAINAGLRRLGVDTKTELTAHGWRSVARTMLHERLGFAPEVIEHQLAHAVPDALGRAYNRTRFAEERTRMMQAWADFLDGLRQGKDGNSLP